MEMNTRIQVEHTVTELVTGLDLVREQIRVAAGEPLSIRQEDVCCGGTRSSAGSTPRTRRTGFLPSPGRITSYREPSGPGVRVDSAVAAGSEVSGLYDPMIAKLIVHDADREHARRRMLRALSEFEIGGVTTLVGFHGALLEHPSFIAAETCHGLVESEELAQAAEEFSHRTTTIDAASDGLLPVQATVPRSSVAEVDGRRVEVRVFVPEPGYRALARRRREREAGARAGAGGSVVSPMQGTVIDVKVADGDAVEAGAGDLHRRGDEDGERGVRARRRASSRGWLSPGEQVSAGQLICAIGAA